MTDQEILAIQMQENDAEAATIRDYLKELLRELWRKGEGFSGKRPFGNSGWEGDLELALVKAGAIAGKVDADGYLQESDTTAAVALINSAIDAL